MGSCHERDIVLKALILSVPACTLFAGAAVLSFRSRSVPSLLQLGGQIALVQPPQAATIVTTPKAIPAADGHLWNGSISGLAPLGPSPVWLSLCAGESG